MSDIQKQVENRVGQLDTSNQLRDFTAAQAIIRAKELGIKSITPANYESLGYRERIGKPTPEKIAQLDRIFQQVKNEWSSIQNETKKETGKVRALFQTRQQLSDEQVEGRAISNLERANQFKYINTELNKAFTKDLQGHFVEGGILGMLNNPNTALKKAVDNISRKYPDMAGEVMRALEEISGNAKTAQAILNQDTSQGRKVGEWFASIFGYKRGGQITKYWATNPNFQKYMRSNLLKNLVSGGLSILGFAASGVIYGGRMKTPFKIQSIGTPDKNIVARALYGGTANARDIIQGSIQEIDSYISRGMRNGVRGPATEKLQKGIAEGIGIDATRAEHDINQANNTFNEFIDRIPLIGLIFDEERALRKNMDEYSRIMENTNPSEKDRARAIYLNGKISNKLNATRANFQKKNIDNNRGVAIQTIDDVIAGTRQVVAVEALREGNKLKAFLNSHRTYADVEGKLPTKDPIVRQAFQAYYSGKSFNGRTGDTLLQYIWEDRSIPGVQAMVKAYTKGNYTDRQKYMRDYCSSGVEGKTISTIGSTWGEDISNIIHDPDAIKNYISSHRNKNNGLLLAYGYASKVDQLTRGLMIIAPGAILNNITNGHYDPNFEGQNTGVSTSSLTNEYNYDGPAHSFRVPATIDGIRGYLTIGIKPNCANLVIGGFETENYNPNNPDANILFRLPLLWAVHGGTGGSSSPSSSTPGSTQGASNGNGALNGGPVSGSALPGGGQVFGGVSGGSAQGF